MADCSIRNGVPQITRLAEDRQVVRLGATVFKSGAVEAAAMDEVCGVLRRFQETWRKHDVLGVRAVATSATRDASNQAEFVTRASDAVGAPIETISGQEEARLIHLGVQTVWPQPRQQVLMVDVGGGSAELIASEGGVYREGYSRPLGAVRLTEVFLKKDPPSEKQVKELEEYIEEKLTLPLRRLGGRRYDRVIATSASAAAVVCAANRIARTNREAADRKKATVGQVRKLYRELIERGIAERRRIPGIGPRRAEIIVPGAAVFWKVLERFGQEAMYYSI
ncbi:MAG: Ppx/GppA family phosphatase, partial [Bryobacteraceae bacterium]|nr:Ppx/GppA family phosphatase [Bryobacteraceae bacterium]